MGNENSINGGPGETRSFTHIPESSSHTHSNAPPQNVAVDTESNQPLVTIDEPIKVNDEQINITRAGIQKPVKKEDGEEPPPPPSQKEQLVSIKLKVEEPAPTQTQKLNARQVQNAAGGYSFKVCDMNRLRRYIVLGSEHSTYYTQGTNNGASLNALENINCLNNLLDQKRHEEVLDTITQYSLSGRVAKEDPILIILAQCAGHKDETIRKAALKRVVKICNIPTKLFRFIDLHQSMIDDGRQKSPPEPQKWKTEEKRKKKNVEKSMENLKIEGEDNAEMKTEEPKRKEPCENTDTSIEEEGAPPIKKKKKEKKPDPEFKKVNKTAKKSSGWGRMRRKAIADFYTDESKDGARLLYVMTKYKSRHNWSHQSVVTYSHPKMKGENADAKNLVVKYCTGGYDKVKAMCSEEACCKPGLSQKMSETINYINQLEEVIKLDANKQEDVDRLLEILNKYGIREQKQEFLTATTVGDGKLVKNTEGRKSSIQIVREHLPTGFLKNKEVWKCLLMDMPMTALIRNLGKITSMGIFDEQVYVDIAVHSLTNVHKLKTARVHPMKVLIALQQYQKGHGDKGSLAWSANPAITKALDDAFYKSFKQPEVANHFKTHLNYMLCLDVSGSMSFGGCVGCELITPAMASVAMAWVTWNIEDNVEVMAFGGHLEDMKKRGFNKDMLINDAMYKTSQINFGSTDCSLPMVYAKQKQLHIDVFIVYTDNDTWSGRLHPVTALNDYNKTMKHNSKLIVCGMQSNGFTIADPQDPNMMDVVGFDASVPELISEFAKGNLSGSCSSVAGACPDCDYKKE